MNLELIKLDNLEENIFSEVAEQTADFIHPQQEKDKFGNLKYDNRGKPKYEDTNKSTQLRKFYDELVMWHDKVFYATDRSAAYRQAAPFIHMLKAKVAYSQGRGHVDQNFVEVFNKIISEIKSPETLKHAKLFFEAVLGFRKAKEQK